MTQIHFYITNVYCKSNFHIHRYASKSTNIGIGIGILALVFLGSERQNSGIAHPY